MRQVCSAEAPRARLRGEGQDDLWKGFHAEGLSSSGRR